MLLEGIRGVEREAREPGRDAVVDEPVLVVGAQAHGHDDAIVEAARIDPALREVATQRAGDGREHHVVHRPTEAPLHGLHAFEIELEPVEAAIRSEPAIVGRRGGPLYREAGEARDRAQPRSELALERDRRRERTGDASHERATRLHLVSELVGQELPRGRSGARPPGRWAHELGRGLGREQRGEQAEGRDAVGHRVVGLHEQREAAAREAVHEPELPERSSAVERTLEQARRHPPQLGVVARRAQARAPHVTAQVEAGVVHPDRAAEERHPGQTLAIARREVEPGAHVGAQPCQRGRAAVAEERPALEAGQGAEMHRMVGRFEDQERAILRREPLVGGRAPGG